MMKKRLYSLALTLMLSMIPAIVFAEAAGIGQVADNMFVPVSIVSGFIASASIVIGIMCLFASIIRYSQYRINPLAHPISTVITLFILGVLLLILPFIYKLTDSGIPYNLS